jgi:hypothetical protein
MKLPVIRMVKEAYAELLAHPWRFLLGAATTLPFITLLPEALLQWDDPLPLLRLRPIVEIAPYVAFALVWLRLLPQKKPHRSLPDRALGNLGAAYLASGGLFLLLFWPPFTQTFSSAIVATLEIARSSPSPALWEWYQESLLRFAVALAWCVFLARFSIVIPAAAQGESISLRAAWHATTGNTLSLPTACLVATVPLLTAAVLVYGEVAFGDFYFQTPLDRATGKFFAAPLELAAAALFMNVLASAYRQLPGSSPGSSPGHEQILMRFK